MELLVAVDFSEGLKAILAQARQWAKWAGAQVRLIHVVEHLPERTTYSPDLGLVGDGTAMAMMVNAPDPKDLRNTAAHRLQDARRRLQQEAQALQAEGVEVLPLVVEGPVVKTLLEEVDRHRPAMIVMGSHGHGAVHQLLVGSVSEGVLRKATCPVLVVPTHKRA